MHDRRRFRPRWLVLVGSGLAVMSTAFPLYASLTPAQELPSWAGPLDVLCAGALVLAAVAVIRIGGPPNGRVVAACYRAYRAAASLLLVGLAVFFVVGDAIRWDVLVPGLTWRAWLFAHALPGTLTLWWANAPDDGAS